MATHVAWLILAGYASLIIELTALRVPSVASSLNIWSPRQAVVALYSARYQRFFEMGRPLKLAVFVAPLLVVYVVYAYPLLVIWSGPDLLDDYLFAPTAMSDLFGVSLLILGRALTLASVVAVRRDNEQIGQSFRLHTSGVFRRSRNPGLIGMYLFIGGIWVAMPSAGLLAGICVYVLYMDFKVRMEEDFLSNKFGDVYRDYQSRTGRYLS